MIRTSGHDVPFLRALEEVVPTSYSVNVPNAGAWADVPVSWHAGASVVRVLGEMLSIDPSLQAHVDTDLHIVTVTARARQMAYEASQPVAASAAATPPSHLDATATTAAGSGVAALPPLLDAASQTSSQPSLASIQARPATANSASAPAASSAAAPAPQPEPMEWQMRASDGSVRNALARWAREAGWQFIWDVPTDFAVDATATIHGTLQEALRQVAESLSSSRVPIQVVLYERNRVLRVVPKGAS